MPSLFIFSFGTIALLLLAGVVWFVCKKIRISTELKNVRWQLQALADVASLGFCLQDVQGHSYGMNSRFLEILKLSESKIDTDAWLDSLDIQEKMALQTYWQTNRLCEKNEIDCRVKMVTGLRWVLLKYQGVNVDGRFVGHALTLEDITRRKLAEQTLRESELRFARIFQLMPMLATITNVADGRFVDVNQLWEPMLGYTREEAIGHTSLELNAWVCPEERKALIESVLREGSAHQVIMRIRRKNGEIIICEVSGTLVDLEGQHYLLLLIRDVTEERRTAEALRLSEQKLRAAFDNAFQLTGLVAPDGTLVSVNKSALVLGQATENEVVGKPFRDGPWWSHDAQEQLRLDDSIRRATRGESCRYEVRHFDAQGEEHYVDFSLKPIFDENHNVSMLVAEGRDITDLREAGLALQQSEVRFTTIFRESMAPMLVSRFADHVIVDANTAFLDMMGWEPGQVLGKSCHDIELWVDAQDRLHAEELLLEGDGVFRGLEVWWQTSNGGRRRCLLSGRKLPIDNESCVIWGVQDVTGHRAMESEIRELNMRLEERVAARTAELARANRQLTETLATLEQAQDELIRADKLAALGALVAGITHELNTPLGNGITVGSSIQWRTDEFAGKLEAGAIKRSDLAAYIEFMGSGSEILMRNLNQARELVTSFKQVAVDQASSQRREFVLSDLVHEVLRTMHPTLRKAKTHVEVKTELVDGLVLDSYPGPLGQVLTNFITNALLHGFEDREAGVLTIQSRRLDAERVELLFSDNGCGVSQAVMDKIFEPFFTTKLGRGGSGLGLHIVQGIVTRILGGELTVRSNEGQGTTFCLQIPQVAPFEHNSEF